MNMLKFIPFALSFALAPAAIQGTDQEGGHKKEHGHKHKHDKEATKAGDTSKPNDPSNMDIPNMDMPNVDGGNNPTADATPNTGAATK